MRKSQSIDWVLRFFILQSSGLQNKKRRMTVRWFLSVQCSEVDGALEGGV